jgi:predicted DNA-binding transcriptional regulator YafY
VRANRLVAILLLLQARGQLTAAEVAEELEVSERTARRDLEALGMAGVPIYSQQGRNGGWRLAGGGRIDLSGLTAAEARALFLVAGPSSVAATPQVKAALRKLVRALPEPLRSGAEAASSAVVVEPGGWGDHAPPRPLPPLLDVVQRVVVDGEQVELGYVARNREPSTRVVHPLGMAAKGTTWYLVADTEAGLRTFRVDRMTSVAPTGDRVVRPPGFELAQAWQLISDEIEQRRTPVRARALAKSEAVQTCRWILGNRVRIGAAADDGRVEIELRGHRIGSLAGEIAGLGGGIEVLDPPELRDHLARVGAELTATYGRLRPAKPDRRAQASRRRR